MHRHQPPSTGESRNIHSGHAVIFCIVLILVCSLFQSLILSQFIEGPFAGTVYQSIFLVIVLVGTLGSAYWYRRDIFFRLNSLKFAMVLIEFICLSLLLSTIVAQRLPSEAYIQRYGIFLNTIIRSLHLNDIYSSIWFLALQLFLAASLVVCIIREKPWHTRLIGFAMCHAGIVILLTGITVGKFTTFKGNIELRRGEAKRTLTLANGSNENRFITLPFSIQLEKTELDTNPQRFSVYLIYADREKNRLKTFASLPVESNGSLDVYETGDSLKILDYYPDGGKKTLYVEHSEEPRISMAEVRVETENTRLEQRFISGHPQKSNMPDTTKSYQIRYSWEPPGDDEIKALEYKPNSYDTDEHWFEVRYIKGENKEEVYIKDVKPGGTYRVPGTNYTVTAQKYFRHFNLDLNSGSASDASGDPVNPTMEITLRNIENPDESGITDWLFDKNPGFTNLSSDYKLPFNLIYHRLRGRNTYRRHYLIIGSLQEIWLVSEGEIKSRKKFELNEKTEFEEEGTVFIVSELYENAREQEVYFSKSDQPRNPFLRLGIESGGTTRTVVMSALDPEPVLLSKNGYFAVFQPRNEPQIRDFFCDILLKFEGEEIYKGKISINDPFKFGSYYFYHHDFTKDDIEFVNLTVVYDPGYKLVLSGFFLLILGVIHALFIKPLFGEEDDLPSESVIEAEIDENGPKVLL